MLISAVSHLSSRPVESDTQSREREELSEICTAEKQWMSAIVSWLKDIRIEKLLHEMAEIDLRKENALEELKTLLESVEALIASNRGGEKGIHGFIGERAHVYITNARSLIMGSDRICKLIDDNGMTDYYEKGVAVQQKACRAGGKLGLDHLLRHREKYPEFKGIGQIPKDFYEVYKRLEGLSQTEAGRLSRHEWNIWLEIQKIKDAKIVVRPMACTYAEIQRDTIFETIDDQKKKIEREAEQQTRQAIQRHRPSIMEGAKVAATSATVEGVLCGTAKVVSKCRDGKSISEFGLDDAKDIAKATAIGASKGAVRGSVVYAATNYTAISAPVAGATVTVAFDTVTAVKKYSNGTINGIECAKEVGKSAIVASAGALGAKIGGKLIPIPIVGETVGGFLFSFVVDKGFGWLFRDSQPTTTLPSCA